MRGWRTQSVVSFKYYLSCTSKTMDAWSAKEGLSLLPRTKLLRQLGIFHFYHISVGPHSEKRKVLVPSGTLPSLYMYSSTVTRFKPASVHAPH